MGPTDLIRKLLGRNVIYILFPGCIYIRQDQDVCLFKGIRELMEKRQGPGIGMGLENAPEPVMRDLGGCGQCRPDLCGVMSVVIHHRNPCIRLSNDVEPSLGPLVLRQGPADQFRVYPQLVTAGKGCCRIQDIMFPGHLQEDLSKVLTVILDGEIRHAVFIKTNTRSIAAEHRAGGLHRDFRDRGGILGVR